MPYEAINIAPKPVLAAAPQNGSLPRARPPIPSVQLPSRRATKLAARRSNEQKPQPPEHADEEIVRPDVLSLHRPASNLILRGQDGLYFQLFRTHTARELSGFFDSVFWTQTVLRECHYEDAIRHAVIALGALYKTLEQSSASPPSSPSEASSVMEAPSSAVHHWQVAVRQYSEAIKSVVALSSQNQRSHRILLMASVLLACFDSFVGDHRQAIYQIQNGLRLLDQVRAEKRPGTQGPVEDELVQMFTRLAIQAKSYDMAFHFPQPYVIRLTPQTPSYSSPPASPPPGPPQPVIPPHFSSLLEARLAWDSLCETMLRFTETLFARSLGDGPMGILPRSLKQYGAGFKARLDAWAAAFAHILDNRFGPNVSAQEKAGIAVLKMFQIMSQLLFLMTFHDNEAAFDAFTPQFAQIVDLATEVVGDEERRAAAKRCPDPSRCVHRNLAADFMGESNHFRAFHVKPSFSADLGIVPPLYVVATKCRDSHIRRRAIHLLRSSSRREGMWDSQLSGLIGEWVASIEEEPLPGEEPPSPEWGVVRHVPADRRVMVYSVDFDLRSRFARLSVGTRGKSATSPDARARETSIAW